MQEIIDEDLAKNKSKVKIPDEDTLLKDDDKGDNLLLDTLTNIEESYVNKETKKKNKDYDDKMKDVANKYFVKPSAEQKDKMDEISRMEA